MTHSNRKRSLYLFAVVAGAILLALSVWQTLRYAEMKGREAEIAEKIAAAPTPFESQKKYEQYSRVTLTGSFPKVVPVLLYTGPITPNGEPGYDVLRPFDVSAGERVLVNVGWIPQKQYADYNIELPEQRQSFVAVAMEGERPGAFTPDNNSSQNTWFWIDLDALAERFNLRRDIMFMQTPGENRAEGLYPLPREAKARRSLPHARYALTWFSLFLILIVITVILARDDKEKKAA